MYPGSLCSFALSCAFLNLCGNSFPKSVSRVSHVELPILIVQYSGSLRWPSGICGVQHKYFIVECPFDSICIAVEHGMVLPVRLYFVHATSAIRVIFCFTYALIPSGAFNSKKKFGSSGLLLLEGTIGILPEVLLYFGTDFFRGRTAKVCSPALVSKPELPSCSRLLKR